MGSGSWLLAPITGPAKDNSKCDRKGASSDLIRGPRSYKRNLQLSKPKAKTLFLHTGSRTVIMRDNQANRAISTSQLNASPRLHTWPINVVVFHGSQGSTRFKEGFPLRCLQRLSRPYIAMLHCGWRHNSSTRGTSIPVLSY